MILDLISPTAHTASVYLTLAVTAERYVAVCHPFRARSDFTWKQAGYIVFGITIFAVAFNFSRFWEFNCGAVLDQNNTVLHYIPISTSLRRNPLYDKYFVFMGYFVFLYLLPLLTLIVFNSLIYNAVSWN